MKLKDSGKTNPEKAGNEKTISDKKQKKTKLGKKQNKEESEESNEKMVPVLLPSDKATCISVDEMEAIFKTDLKKGLSDEEARRRKKVYGSNDFDVGEDLPLWKKYLNQVKNDLANDAVLCLLDVHERQNFYCLHLFNL